MNPHTVGAAALVAALLLLAQPTPRASAPLLQRRTAYENYSYRCAY
jgi:hypothetical protein